MRGATGGGPGGAQQGRISIHAPHAGRDKRSWTRCGRVCYFNPRAPCGARPHGPRRRRWDRRFQSTRPARGATLSAITAAAIPPFQSTRPARGATNQLAAQSTPFRISIHAPREGRDAAAQTIRPSGYQDFNPRAPRGARLTRFGTAVATRQISIHAPREGRDGVQGVKFTPEEIISIHAPREGRDYSRCSSRYCSRNFNPRAPRGARPDSSAVRVLAGVFQSTRPARGATALPSAATSGRKFQSTRPARGATSYSLRLL